MKPRGFEPAVSRRSLLTSAFDLKQISLAGQPDPTPLAFDGKFGSLTLKRMALNASACRDSHSRLMHCLRTRICRCKAAMSACDHGGHKRAVFFRSTSRLEISSSREMAVTPD